MFSKLSSLQAEVERVREKEDKVKNGIGVLTRKLEGVHKARVEGVRAQIEKLGVDAVPPSLRKKISDILGVEVISACDAGSGKETVDAVDGEIAELRKKVAEVSGRVMALKARVSVRR